MFRSRFRILFLTSILLTVFGLSIPELLYENNGRSNAIGSYGNGRLKNAYLIPFRGNNFKYFSPLSYYILNCGYLHSSVYNTILDAYRTCETTCPYYQFRIMECSRPKGGKMLIHRTHQNGMSADFMIPKMKDNKSNYMLDRLGMWHYLLQFDSNGHSSFIPSIDLDFETMARHLLALDDAAKKNGLFIRKVILKIELIDNLFATRSGQELKRRGIYFAQHLPGFINTVHDEHYHVDFDFL